MEMQVPWYQRSLRKDRGDVRKLRAGNSVLDAELVYVGAQVTLSYALIES